MSHHFYRLSVFFSPFSNFESFLSLFSVHSPNSRFYHFHCHSNSEHLNDFLLTMAMFFPQFQSLWLWKYFKLKFHVIHVCKERIWKRGRKEWAMRAKMSENPGKFLTCFRFLNNSHVFDLRFPITTNTDRVLRLWRLQIVDRLFRLFIWCWRWCRDGFLDWVEMKKKFVHFRLKFCRSKFHEFS